MFEYVSTLSAPLFLKILSGSIPARHSNVWAVDGRCPVIGLSRRNWFNCDKV